MSEKLEEIKPKKKRLEWWDDDARVTISIISYFALSFICFVFLFQLGGSVGGVIRTFLFLLFGLFSWLLPFILFLAGWRLMLKHRNTDGVIETSYKSVWGFVALLLMILGFFSLFLSIKSMNEVSNGGGIIGFIIYPIIFGNFGVIGGSIIMASIFAIGFYLALNMTFIQFSDLLGKIIRNPMEISKLIQQFVLGNYDETEENVLRKNYQKPQSAKPMAQKTIEEDIENPVQKKPKALFSFHTRKDGVIEFKKTSSSQLRNRGWGLPPFDILLDERGEADPGDIDQNKEIIRLTLEQFGVSVEMGEVIVGPTVTQYTLRPANGVRLSAIDNVQRDLALALAVTNIRIQPIPGKTLVGIEVPNTSMSEVRLKAMFQTTEFVDSENLTIAIGKDVAGRNILYPIAKMPHMLVAGATGSGKSVWINGMLLSLLFKYSPSELELILVDMKRVELKLYDGIPHLLTSVITDSEKAINALKWTVLEMDRRYQLLEEHGKRNITDYNNHTKDKDDLKHLPYIVFVIDELADLMMLAKAEVEPIIARLTQMSRAVGIHIVLGTQRPDTSVITGLIKANVPTRIAFAVASQIDSRVIIDTAGAEKLLGKGDGMFLSPTNISPVRFQGANVDESEVKACVEYLKSQLEDSKLVSNQNEEVTQPPKQKIKIPGLDAAKMPGDEGSVDNMYEEAKRIVIQHQKASSSFLQQMMGIGYPKAARIIQELEDNGIVGPQNGSKPRDVYVSPDSLYSS